MPTPREAYTNSVERQGVSGARHRAADFGAAGEAIGRAVQGFGQDLGRVAGDVAKIEERDAELAAREADNIRTAKRLKRLYEGPEGFFNQEGKNALLDQPKLTADLAAIDAEAGAMLKNKPLAARMFGDLTLKRNEDDLPRIFSHTNKQRNLYEDQVDADAFDLAIDTAASSADPTIIEQNLATVGDISERQAKRKGMDGNSLVQARQSGVGKAVASIAQRLEVQSPDEALAFVNAHANAMDPDDVAKLQQQLAPAAAKERAGSDIGNFLVQVGSYAPVAATEGGDPLAPEPEGEAGTTMMPDEAALAAAQWQQESGGVHRLANGKLIASTAGALGVSQTMPKTGFDPGYGVKPLQNQTREEYIRFGNDYRRALIKNYRGNVVLGLTAYNWGPGNVDDHIAKVGDPSKGQISDAAFLNSIPVKEAREYASLILSRTGVSVAGKPGPSASRPAPVEVGKEIDLAATINNIRASDRSFHDKEALIAEATRMHSYGRQVKAENEDRVKDQAWTAINELGEGFTSYEKLPLTLRQQIASNPQLEAQLRGQADSNQARIDAAADKAARERDRDREQTSQLDLLELYYAAPERFNEIDFRTAHPELTFTSRKAMMLRQEAIRKRAANPGDTKTADPSKMRTEINRYAPKENRPENIGVAYDEAVRREQAWIEANPGKPVTEIVRAGIAREVMMPTTIVTKGRTGLFGNNERTVPAYEAAIERANARKAGTYVGMRVEPRQAIRAQLEQIWGRVPTEAEVDAEVSKRTTSKGLRL